MDLGSWVVSGVIGGLVALASLAGRAAAVRRTPAPMFARLSGTSATVAESVAADIE